MKLVRSVVGKVSQNLQYCRSIRNSQSRELYTSFRNNDGNSTKERGVSVLSDVFRKGVGFAVEYGPYTTLGGALGWALTSFGWYAHAYAIADRDSEKNHSEELNDLTDRSELLCVKQRHRLERLGILSEQYRILIQEKDEQNQKLKELSKQLFEQLSELANKQEEKQRREELTKQQAVINEELHRLRSGQRITIFQK